MAAIGPDFKRNYVSTLPVSNADVALTLADILQLPIPNKGSLLGRVLTESLANSTVPAATNVTSGVLASSSASNGYKTLLRYQNVNGTLYFDSASGAPVPEPSEAMGVGAVGLVGLCLGYRRSRKRF